MTILLLAVVSNEAEIKASVALFNPPENSAIITLSQEVAKIH